MTVVACIECCSTGVCVCQVGRVLGDDPAEPDPPGGRQWTHSGPHPPLGHVQPHEWTGESPVMTGKKKNLTQKVKGQEEQAIAWWRSRQSRVCSWALSHRHHRHQCGCDDGKVMKLSFDCRSPPATTWRTTAVSAWLCRTTRRANR